MLKKLLFMPLALLVSGQVYSATLNVDSAGNLLGASNVNVAGSLYDVEFIDGTCADLFSGCDSITDFPFSQGESADAAFALLGQVFLNTPDGEFDDAPNLTRGCERDSNCKALTPVSLGSSLILTSRAARNDERNGGFDSIFFTTLLSANVDLTTDDDQVWAVWSRASEVPLPAAIWLFGTALIGFVGFSKRRKAS